MKKILLVLCLFFISQTISKAEVGYIDYSVIFKKLPLSVEYQKKIDAKTAEIKTYIKTTKEQLNKQQTFEARAKVKKTRKAELFKLEKQLVELKFKKDAIVKEKVLTAADVILNEKKLDMIIDKKYRITGGVDCTEEILKAIK